MKEESGQENVRWFERRRKDVQLNQAGARWQDFRSPDNTSKRSTKMLLSAEVVVWFFSIVVIFFDSKADRLAFA